PRHTPARQESWEVRAPSLRLLVRRPLPAVVRDEPQPANFSANTRRGLYGSGWPSTCCATPLPRCTSGAVSPSPSAWPNPRSFVAPKVEAAFGNCCLEGGRGGGANAGTD